MRFFQSQVPVIWLTDLISLYSETQGHIIYRNKT